MHFIRVNTRHLKLILSDRGLRSAVAVLLAVLVVPRRAAPGPVSHRPGRGTGIGPPGPGLAGTGQPPVLDGVDAGLEAAAGVQALEQVRRDAAGGTR